MRQTKLFTDCFYAVLTSLNQNQYGEKTLMFTSVQSLKQLLFKARTLEKKKKKKKHDFNPAASMFQINQTVSTTIADFWLYMQFHIYHWI